MPSQSSESGRSEVDSAMSAASSTPTGWDPYEVWRTRVLLPRLGSSITVLRQPAARAPGPGAAQPRHDRKRSIWPVR